MVILNVWNGKCKMEEGDIKEGSKNREGVDGWPKTKVDIWNISNQTAHIGTHPSPLELG